MNERPEYRIVRAFTTTPSSISRIREAYAMSAEAFARFVGITAATLASWESGAARPRNTLEERALDSVVGEALLRFPDLKIGIEPNPDAK